MLNFINGFNKKIQAITGDIKKENIENRFQFSLTGALNNRLVEKIDGFDYSLKKVRALLEKYFKIVKEVRPVLNHYHKFFILEKI